MTDPRFSETVRINQYSALNNSQNGLSPNSMTFKQLQLQETDSRRLNPSNHTSGTLVS